MANSAITNFYNLKTQARSENRKQRNDAATKEGVLVNNFIKGNETICETINIPQNAKMPDDLYMKDKKISNGILNNPIIPLIAVPLIVLGGGAALTKMYKSSFKLKKELPQKDQLQGIGRVITINDDNNLVLYLLTQDPNTKTLLAATSVLAASGGAVVMKNVVDGFKEVWVQRQKADIKRNLEEDLIDVETRSFDGKNQILRSIIADSSKQLKEISNETDFKGHRDKVYKQNSTIFKNSLSFKNEEEDTQIKKTNITMPIIIAGIATLGASIFFTKSILKNVRAIAKKLESNNDEARKKLNEGFKKLSEKDLVKELTKSKLKPDVKDVILREHQVLNGENPEFRIAPEMMGGIANKTSFSSYVQDITAYLYTYIINPTKQTRNLMLLVFGNAIGGYLGKTAVEAGKEVQVEKENAQTELELQNKLVQVELKNFLAKKKSFVAPIIQDFKIEAIKTDDKDKLKQEAENALFEIKTGPPFVYS